MGKAIWVPDLEKRSGPIYQAIADAIEQDIAHGALKPGDRLPPQRALAYELAVTLGTITRAYEEAERRKLVRGETGRGTFIRDVETRVSPLAMSRHEEPEIMDMARNFVLPDMDPDIAEALAALSERADVQNLLRYTPPEGSAWHREAGAHYFNTIGIEAGHDDVIMTMGSQHGISLILSALFRPGDILAVDALVYPGLIASAARLGVNLLPVAHDAGGMLPEQLAALCQKHAIRGIFLTPNVQNPTAATLSESRRVRIAEIVETYDALVIEDDPFTPYMVSRPPSFATLIPNRTIALASVSKVLGAGLRIGYARVPARHHPAMQKAMADSVWMATPLTAEIAAYWIMTGTLKRVLARKQEEIAIRYHCLRQAVGHYDLRGAPEKVFAWLQLPESINVAHVEAELARHKVSVLGAHHFQIGARPTPPALRVTLGAIASRPRFEFAVQSLKATLAGY